MGTSMINLYLTHSVHAVAPPLLFNMADPVWTMNISQLGDPALAPPLSGCRGQSIPTTSMIILQVAYSLQ